MTPGARIQATIELLGLIAAEPQDASAVIDGYFKSRRFAGAGDRRDVSHRVYENMRHHARLDWWIERTGVKVDPAPRSRVLAQLAVYERTSPDALASLFSGTRHCPSPLTEGERELADSLYGRPPQHADMPEWVRLEFPAWMGPSLHAIFGDRLAEELQALSQTAPVDIRANTLKATREAVQAALAADKVETVPTHLSPLGLRLTGRARLGGTHAFKQGWFEVQDEGSQLLALLCGVRPGMTVVDYCAGAGGKTLALAAALGPGRVGGGRGRVIACDVSRYRMDRMEPRLRRSGATNVRCQVVTARDDSWVKANQAMADRVLVDAPCTGTGAWRRNLDAKWRFQPDDVANLVETQRLILAQASTLVAPGGRLIYATCSLLREENEDQMAWFQANLPGFTLLPMPEVWAETVGGPCPAAGDFLRLSPASTDTDGFFCAVLEKPI